MTKDCRYPRLFERLYNRPLLLQLDKAITIEQVFRAHLESPFKLSKTSAFFDDGDVEDAGDETDDAPVTTGAGIAVVPVMGTLMQRSSWMDAMSGITSYADIERDFTSAANDPAVRGILLEIDSGGGEVSGCFDLVDLIAACEKPVWAVANEAAYSAAYAIASAADRLFMPRTAGVGSIGVIALHVDQSQADAKKGLVYTPIFAGDHKYDGNSHEPLPDDVKSSIQADIDRLHSIFVSTVAQNRGITAETVVGTQADVYHPAAAIDLGLADDVGTLADALTLFAQALDDADAARAAVSLPATSRSWVNAAVGERPDGALAGIQIDGGSEGLPPCIESSTAATAATTKGVHMDPKKDQAVDPATQEAAINAARAEGEKAGRTAVVAEAATAERARCAAIVTSEEAIGRSEMANHLAFESDMAADRAVALLAKSPKTSVVAATNAFAAAMDAAGNPAIRADVEKDPDAVDPDTEDAAVAAILAFQRKPASTSK